MDESKIPKPYGVSPRAVVTIFQREDGSTTVGGERREEILPEPWAPLDRALGELLDGSPAGHTARMALAMQTKGVGLQGAGALAHAIVGPLERLRGLLARDGAEAWWTERDGMLAADAALLDALDEPAESEYRQARASRWAAARDRITAGRERVSLRPPGSALTERLMDPHWGHWPEEPRDELSGVLSPFWLRWIRPTERGKGALALVVEATWERRVRGPIESKVGAALPARSLEAFLDVTVPPKRRARQRQDGQYELILPDERIVGLVEPGPRLPVVTVEAVEALVGPSSSSIGLRVVRYVAREAFDRSIAGGTGARIIIEGGFQALANVLGLKGRRSAEELPAVLDALASLRVELGRRGHTWLLQWSRRDHTITLTAGDGLLPGSVHALDRLSPEERARARLVPIPRLTPDPVLSPQYRARENALQLVTMGLFAERARELVERGGIEVLDRDWRTLADRAGLPYAKVRDRVLPAWQSGEERFLAYAGTRWTLGPAYEDERRHLELAGGMRARAAERGRRGARRRHGKP